MSKFNLTKAKAHIFKQRNLYIALSALWLSACNGGSSSSSNNVHNSVDSTTTGYTLNKYISQLRHVSLDEHDKVASKSVNIQSRNSPQVAYIASKTTTMANVQIKFYGQTLCQESSWIFTYALYPHSPTGESTTFLNIAPGTYYSSDVSNFNLCSWFESNNTTAIQNCQNEYNLVYSMKFVYNQYNGESTESCLTNRNNPFGTGDWIGDYTVPENEENPCTGPTSCGFSQNYHINLTYAPGCNPCNVFITDLHDGNFGGIQGADTNCQHQAGYYNVPGTYRALITDGTNRHACTTPNCGTGGIAENKDWIMYPGTQYVWAYAPANESLIWTTNESGIYVFGSLQNNYPFGLKFYWTGFSGGDWASPTIDNLHNCNGWTSNSGNIHGALGAVNATDSTPSRVIFDYLEYGCANEERLFCVQQ